MKSAAGERERLIALLAALEEPARARTFSPDDATLVAVARHHRLTPLLSITCGASLPPPLAESFRRARLVTGARNLMLGQAAEACIQAFAAAGIPTIVLKGLDYETRLYDLAAARPTSDVDLLIPERHRRSAFEVLDRLGFEPRAAAPGFDDADYHEVAWTRAAVEVDLHLALAPLARCRIDYQTIWAAAEPQRIGQTEARVLAIPHAIIFHALHMAIDHFDVPAISLIDLSRLLARCGDFASLLSLAKAWRCYAPLQTSLALTRTMMPRAWRQVEPETSARARHVIARYGDTAPLPRSQQILRKLAHFDGFADVLRYVAIQTRRNLHEQVERRFRHRDARDRLKLPRRFAAEDTRGIASDPGFR